MFPITFGSILLAFVVVCTGADNCMSPQPYQAFNYTKFTGLWYEIGKIQTPGGAKFQAHCVCTVTTLDPSKNPPAEPINAKTVYSCRNKKPDGIWTNVSAVLNDENPPKPGAYIETFFPNIPPISYNVNYHIIDMDEMGEEYAMEYDCDSTDYCVHIFSRRPTLDKNIVQSMTSKAEKMGLNPLGLSFKATNQTGCWK